MQSYTLSQVRLFSAAAARLERAKLREQLSVITLAVNGERKDVEAFLRRLTER